MKSATPETLDGDLALRAELRLLLRWARLSEPSLGDVDEFAAGNLDWDLLATLARRHGLVPLAYRHLSRPGRCAAPQAVVAQLRGEFNAIAARNLLLTTHLFELLDECDKAAIRALPYKGLVVSQAYYGSLVYRPIADIDLLVDPRQANEAFRMMQLMGYISHDNDSRGPGDAFLCTAHHRTYERAGVAVEIHWNLAPWRFRLPLAFASLWKRTERVVISNRSVPNLSPEDALVVLAAHGARHQWERLIWLVDIARLISTHPQLCWDTAIKRAGDLGCLRIVLLSLHLCNRLLSTRIPEHLCERIEMDSQIPCLTAIIEQRLSRTDEVILTRSDDDVFGIAVRERLRDRLRLAWPRRSAVTRDHEEFFPFPARFWMALAIGFTPVHSPLESRRPSQTLLRPLRAIASRGLQFIWHTASLLCRK